jgi:hypothetical protein
MRVRAAPGLPFALRFIALGAAFFALGFLFTALTGGEVLDKAAGRPMTTWEVLRLSASLAIGAAASWWLGGWLRRVRGARIGLPPARNDPM